MFWIDLALYDATESYRVNKRVLENRIKETGRGGVLVEGVEGKKEVRKREVWWKKQKNKEIKWRKE